MCGISLWNVETLTPEQIEEIKMKWIMAIQSRGKDGSAITLQPNTNLLFGFHRLAIINTSTIGMQPFVSDGNTLICNGEIYNYKQLSENAENVNDLRSDVDVIHRLFKDVDVNSVEEVAAATNKLDGDFAFIFAKEDGRFVVGRDPVGVRPLFYGVNSDGRPIAFASEAKALHGGPAIDKVFVFPPNTVYVSSINRFAPIPDKFLLNQVNKLVTNAVKKRLDHSDRPVGLLCSGGVDSAIITSLTARLSDPTKMHVFTMEYANGTSEDAFYASMLCARHKFKHTVVKFDAKQVQECLTTVIATCETYDPNTIRAAIPMYLLAKHIAENTDIKVILSGEGADELFAGYSYFKRADAASLNAESRRLIKNVHMFDLLRADRCFAAFGLECRVPYLDRDLISFVSCIEGEHKMFQKGAEKMLLRNAFADLKDLADLRILSRTKEKFSDGCGFSYVPQLLNFVSDNANTLDEKLKAESAKYKAIFESIYGDLNGHWIIKREMPAWSAGTANTANTANTAIRNNEIDLM